MSFEFTCTRDDLEYWLSGTAPVLLVISKPRDKQAWWVSVKDYFRTAEHRQTRRIRFDKQSMRFDQSSGSDLVALSFAAGSGTYFRPPPKNEILIANLLPVTRFPTKLYRAATAFHDREDVRMELKKRVEWPETEYVLPDGLITCVHDLRNDPWPTVCDVGTIETVETAEWRDSDDREIQRHFTQMLNLCLARRVSPMGIHYLKEAEALYFKASNPVEGAAVLPKRTKSYKSRTRKTSRDVFEAYFSKSDPTRVAYYRHVGFERHFRRIGGKWFLEINPTYHYTTDGREPHPFREEYLSKIKTIEGNNAVAGGVVMFAALLQDELSLFRETYAHLGFGVLERVQVPVGIEDSSWRNRDELQPLPVDVTEGAEQAPARGYSTMKADFLHEPELEFGNGCRHIDVRFGLTHFGPLDAGGTGPHRIRVGVVGDDAMIELFQNWLDRCRQGIEAKRSTLPTLFPPFKGFGETGAFCDFVSGAQLSRAISPADLDRLAQLEPTSLMIERAVDRYLEEAKDLALKSPDVIVCILSPKLLKRIDIQSGERKGPRTRRKRLTQDAPDKVEFHDLLKARGMSVGRPLQVSRPGTLGGDVQRYRLDGTANVDMQDEASRAWNFFCALYYKAGGTPWRLVRDSTELTTCYVGVSFFETKDGSSLQTSVAQIFNERGEGVVVRGGPAKLSKEDRTPHLEQDDAAKLLQRALSIYRREHRTMPARLVCHKSSYFTDAEVAGFSDGAQQERIDALDLVSMRKSLTRLYRQGSYPPLRGTYLELDTDESLLYTNGSVDFYRSYPGLYVPRPLSLTWDAIQQAPRKLLREVLALTKMNWNTTVFANAEPITICAARVVGDIMRHIGTDDPLQEGYSFYM